MRSNRGPCDHPDILRVLPQNTSFPDQESPDSSRYVLEFTHPFTCMSFYSQFHRESVEDPTGHLFPPVSQTKPCRCCRIASCAAMNDHPVISCFSQQGFREFFLNLLRSPDTSVFHIALAQSMPAPQNTLGIPVPIMLPRGRRL